MKKNIAILSFILIFIIGGCTYNGYLQQGFHEPSKPIKSKIELSAALVNTQELKDYRVQEYTGGQTFTFYFNPAFNEELVKELSGVFSSIQIIDTPRELDKYDIQIIPAISYRYIEGSAWNGQYRYNFTVALTVKNARSNTVIDEFKDTNDIIISTPISVNVLSFLTGLSLFILSPITIPLATQAGGASARSTIEDGVSRSFKVLSYQIANSPKIYNYRPRQGIAIP